jgi:hypothetical protein
MIICFGVDPTEFPAEAMKQVIASQSNSAVAKTVKGANA